MSATPDPCADNPTSGLAVLAEGDASETFEAGAGPWPVNGVAMTPSVTHGGAGVARFWPEETLREAAERGLLEDRPIVKNFHDLEGQADADDVIGEVTDTGYADGVGLVFEGEIADAGIAQKVANDYLDVSVVPHISAESYDPDRDVHVVEEIADFRDIAVVATGAMADNSIEIGTNPAVSALADPATVEALSQAFPDSDGAFVRAADAAPTDALTMTDALQEGTRLEAWAALLAQLAGTVSTDDLDVTLIHQLLAGEIPDATPDDVASAIPAGDFDSGFDAAAAESALTGLLDGAGDDGGDSGDDGDQDADDDDSDADDAASALPQATGLTAALADELGLTTGETRPEDVRTIKDGAMTLDLESSALARQALGLSVADDDGPSIELSEGERESALADLEIGDDTDDDTPAGRAGIATPVGPDDDETPTQTIFDDGTSETIDPESDPVARQGLGLEAAADDDDESAADAD